MPAKVIITVMEGPLKGRKYRFDEKMLCIVGRADNSTLVLSDDAADGVSRHHCMLDIKPPFATIQDMGSRNGTLLNGVNIGRPLVKSAVTPVSPVLNIYKVSDGDIFQVGSNVFNVSLVPAVFCPLCGKDAGENPPASGLCSECAVKQPSQTPVHPASRTLKMRFCLSCGGDLSASPQGETLCERCKSATRPDDSSSTVQLPAFELRQSNLLSIEGYTVIKRIGKGGMGAVYLAESKTTKEIVALKILLPEIAVNEQCRKDFLREAETLKQLRHPNIVELKSSDYSSGALYIALEYCSGGNLRDYMKTLGGPLDLNTALMFTYNILNGLDYAHNVQLNTVMGEDDSEYGPVGIVHRDIKPDNIFISSDESGSMVAKISDFGIAKAFDLAGVSGCTRTGDFSGTLGFIPKQQYLNFKYVKPEVDVWAAAATLYYMLTVRAPRDFSAPDFDPGAIFSLSPVPVAELNPNVPPNIAEVIDIALDDSVKFNFKTAKQLRTALSDAV